MKRGEIYFISDTINTVGYELGGNHPAIIVSNDMTNKYSDVVSVVFLTTAEKRENPTRVIIESTLRRSTALCENVYSYSKERLPEQAVAVCTDEEMARIDKALAIAMGLEIAEKSVDLSEELKTVKAQRDAFKMLYETLSK